MACSRGKAAPNAETRVRLFMSSGGYCQNPGCLKELFIETGSKAIHVAELAHVFAANDDGPRAPGELSAAERGAFENLIVLCPTCHTMIDKAEADFPAALLTEWKQAHREKLARAFGAVRFGSRGEVRRAIEPMLAENAAIFEALNPNLDYADDPEAGEAVKWQAAMRERIIPNNRRILAIVDENREHLDASEVAVVEQFRMHLGDLEMRHFTDTAPAGQARFPAGMNTMMMEAG